MVFSTKNRSPFLDSEELRKNVFQHIKKNAEDKNIWLDTVISYQEHAYCLISLGKEQTISKEAQLIKGESSFWINQNQLTKEKFIWQDDYWAAGASYSPIEAVRKYIQKQEIHHSKHTFFRRDKFFFRKKKNGV
jgi:REP element-mobilizing transposase RayT